MTAVHVSVLLTEVVRALAPSSAGLIVDATLGLGGHAAALLEAAPSCTLLGLDRDPRAIAESTRSLARFGGRVELVCTPFSRLPELLNGRRPLAILADFGVSSMQIDQPERGFSFSVDGPLDMRMGDEGRTAAELVAELSERELADTIYRYGEERRSRAIARAICRRRSERPFERTHDLAALVAAVVGYHGKIHPATRTFQALRIAVNDELGEIERFVEPAVRCLAPAGRLGVISFHSLEDRTVKQRLRSLEGRCTCPPSFPVCTCERQAVVENEKLIRPSQDEIASNPRSRSARLRVTTRLPIGEDQD